MITDDILTAENCKHCGKVVLSGKVDSVPIQADFEDISYPDAVTLENYGVPLVQVVTRKVGDEIKVYAKQAWITRKADEWKTLVAHGCDWNPWKR